jgi:hypothetical protein
MAQVKEFRNHTELNDYLRSNPMISEFHIVPIARLFENPATKLLTNTITYVLIMN